MTRTTSPLLTTLLATGLLASPSLAFAQADGTPGNPAGTAASRAIDRTLGVPTIPDGAPGNPPGTALGRTVDRAAGQVTRPDGTPGNPPGTVVDRAAERAAAAVTEQTTRMAAPAPVVPGSLLITRQRMTQVIGGNIYNDRNDRIGEVEDVVLRQDAMGPIAIIQVGGFLGMGGRLVAVPLNDLRWNAERSQIMLPGATKEQLQTRPAFTFEPTRRG